MVDIITPSKRFYSGEIEMLIVNTYAGLEGFMAKHSWTTKLLKTGLCQIREKDSKELKTIALADGFVDVRQTILVFADAAEWAEDIDISRAEKGRIEYEKWLEDHDTKDRDEKDKEEERRIIKARLGLARALSRVKIASRGL
jgi:F-type H+-transporting ATPase subunit epsilon